MDNGPSQRHAESIRTLTQAEVGQLNGGPSLVNEWAAMMEHVETNIWPILQLITPENVPECELLEDYTQKWKHLVQGARPLCSL